MPAIYGLRFAICDLSGKKIANRKLQIENCYWLLITQHSVFTGPPGFEPGQAEPKFRDPLAWRPFPAENATAKTCKNAENT